MLVGGDGRLPGDDPRRLDLGLLSPEDRGGVSRRRAVDRPVGRRRGAGGDADQRRHVRRHTRPPLPDRRQLDLDLVRRLDRLGHLGDLRRAQASAVRRADGRGLRRQALRQRRRAHAGGGADHPHLHDPADRPVPGDRRDRVRHLRHRAARRDGRAAGEHRLLHRARRRALELVHRLRADADHGAGAAAGGADRHLACRRPDGARRIRRLDRAPRHRLVVHVARARRLRHRVRLVDRGRAVRDDALLFDARRRDGALRDRHLAGGASR